MPLSETELVLTQLAARLSRLEARMAKAEGFINEGDLWTQELDRIVKKLQNREVCACPCSSPKLTP